MSDSDRRYTPGSIEIRSDRAENGSVGRITGHAAVFDSRSEDLGGFTEFIAPGAFDQVLEEGADVRWLVNHDPNMLIGRTSSGTLRLSVDDVGLRMDGEVSDTTAGRDLMANIKLGNITGASFQFTVGEDKWASVDGKQERTILRVDSLLDVGPVAFPAYPGSNVAAASLRSLDAVQHPNLAKYRPIVAAWAAKYL